jgi:transcription initiation factor TFIIIB Brf1 subunit/transcription initiation factor TFIIB
MAIKNYPKNTTGDTMNLTCDLCNSHEIIKTDQGFVCSECGLVLEQQRMEYHRPYEQQRVQHSVSQGGTTIGYTRERFRNKNSRKLDRLQKIQYTQPNRNYVNYSAKIEISRLLTGLDLPHSFKEPIFKVFKVIRAKLQKGTKYRNPDKLVPTLIYFYCKKEKVTVDERELLEISKVNKKDYSYCKLKISGLIPKYYERNRKKLILNKVLGIIEEYGLEMDFYRDVKTILMKLWEGIKLTTDDVIAGLVSSIAILCHYRETITVSAICKTLNIEMSTIQSQVKRKIIQRFNVPGFQSLVSSADLLKTVMYKLGVFNSLEGSKQSEKVENFDKKKSSKGDTGKISTGEKEQSIQSQPRIIEMEIVKPEENKIKPRESDKKYLFAIAGPTSEPIFVIIKYIHTHINQKLENYNSKHDKRLICNKIQYYYPKGPPLQILE